MEAVRTRSKNARLAINDLKANALYRATIYGSGDERIGSASHICGSGSSSQIVVDVGFFIGVGATPVALPPGQLEFMRDEDDGIYVVKNWAKDRFEELPENVG